MKMLRSASRQVAATARAGPAPAAAATTVRRRAPAAARSSTTSSSIAGTAAAATSLSCARQQQQRWQRPARAAAAAAAAADGSSTDTGADAEAEAFAVAMARVADDTKAQDLAVLHVAPLVSWTSYFVICTVISKPQLLAVMARMERLAEEEWGRSKQNSPGSSPWEVLDYGDVVVHVFTPDQREHYDIESFYAAAEEVDLPFGPEQQQQQQQQGGPAKDAAAAGAAGNWTKRL